MGGYGSGRSGGAPLIEDGLILDINKLRRDGLLGPGIQRRGSLEWTETSTGRSVGSVEYEARIGDEEGTLRLIYATTRYATGEKIRSDYEIGLETVAQPFGGRRWYFECPATGARVCKLYKVPGSTRFLSRGAYRRIAYHSQREAPHDRALSFAFKLRRRLGDQGAIGDWLGKPKWMRWPTFERQLKRIERAEAVIDAHTGVLLQRLGGRV
jgi:hypothetical protein